MKPLIVLAALAAACTRPLPEEGAASAELYRARCGSCHRPYAPSVTRFATWEMILPRMEQRIAQAKQPPLSAEERDTIREYLRRHSEGGGPG